MKRFFSLIIVFASFCFPMHSTVIMRLGGQLGNQMFQIAAGLALAHENNCPICIPQFPPPTNGEGLLHNYNMIFHRIPNRVDSAVKSCFYLEPDNEYRPIPYRPGIEVQGYFLSEKYFKKYKDLICTVFAVPEGIESDLYRDHRGIIEHPKTVAIHVRTFYRDAIQDESFTRFYSGFLPPDIEYYKKAVELFEPDSLFVVFSDHIEWCKREFQAIDRNFVFIENQDYLHDFYLISKCKHVINGSSSFSWWAAYLNKNPDKKVVCRRPYMATDPAYDLKEIICDDWVVIEMPTAPPIPVF